MGQDNICLLSQLRNVIECTWVNQNIDELIIDLEFDQDSIICLVISILFKELFFGDLHFFWKSIILTLCFIDYWDPLLSWKYITTYEREILMKYLYLCKQFKSLEQNLVKRTWTGLLSDYYLLQYELKVNFESGRVNCSLCDFWT